MDDLKTRQAEMRELAVRVNAGREPRFGDVMRNPWASESNPQRDGIFVSSKRITGHLNPGMWYQMTDGAGKFWNINGDCAMFIEHIQALEAVGIVGSKE